MNGKQLKRNGINLTNQVLEQLRDDQFFKGSIYQGLKDLKEDFREYKKELKEINGKFDNIPKDVDNKIESKGREIKEDCIESASHGKKAIYFMLGTLFILYGTLITILLASISIGE